MATPKQPQDRRPKADKGVDREVVSLGLDFRPLPIDVGDGKVWYFDPDPDPDKWNAIQIAGGALAELKDAKTAEERTQVMSDGIKALRVSVMALLTDEEQKTEFEKRGYGFGPLQKFALTLVEQTSGFPTE